MIVGGGYNRKSTLLKALERGIYNYVLNDVREYVITDDIAVKLRSEDVRAITGTIFQCLLKIFLMELIQKCFILEVIAGGKCSGSY